MQALVVKMHWPIGEHLYGVLLHDDDMLVVWDGPNEPWVIPFAAFPKYELVGKEVTVPDDLPEVAHRYIDSLDVLQRACPQLIRDWMLREAAAAAGHPFPEDQVG